MRSVAWRVWASHASDLQLKISIYQLLVLALILVLAELDDLRDLPFGWISRKLFA
jgi:hypothetical protein